MKPFLTYTFLISIAILCSNEYVGALPPLGLTHMAPSSGGQLEIIDGSAYISAGPSMYRIDSAGTVTEIELEHPDVGAPISLTRAVNGPDGKVYVGANFNSPAPPFFMGTVPAAALFRLDEPNGPIVTWERDVDAGQRLRLVGVDARLRGVGELDTILDPAPSAAEFQLDGIVTELERPAGSCCTEVTDVAASGYALGYAHVPGTIGGGIALWTPSGSFSFVSTSGNANSLRDRLDGEGVNIGYNDLSTIKYGSRTPFFITNPDGHFMDANVIVSHSDFLLVEDPSAGPVEEYLAYFPGIVPDALTQAVPLFDILPELESVNFDRISDLAAVDGHIFMTLTGPDGLYLFGARDPSVIPEPQALPLAILTLAFGVVLMRARTAHSKSYASSVSKA